MMPFIIVAFLVITSLFSGELSGFLVLVGILLSSLLTIGASNFSFVQDKVLADKDKILECSILTINGGPLSYLPLSTHIFTFIWGYFIYAITKNSVVTNNGFLIALMTILVAIDLGYNWTSCCGVVMDFSCSYWRNVWSSLGDYCWKR